jgi:prepilin peptidase CpaA
VIPEILVFVALPALLIAAALWDLASYTIPNFLQLAILACFVVFAAEAGMAPTAVGLHLAAGLFGLVIGFAFFALGYIGGGDAKLFACAALWFGLHDLTDFALFSAIFGGLLTLGLLGFRKIPLPHVLRNQAWLLRLHDARGDIPYGAALAAGAFAILPYTDVFRIGVSL